MGDTVTSGYRLEAQVGYILRRATQRHIGIFSDHIDDLTSTQFAALAKLCELGSASQNALGRATAMDAATIKGVVDRLRRRGYLTSKPDPEDQRRMSLAPTPQGRAVFTALEAAAHTVTKQTLAPLTASEQRQFLAFLERLT